MAESERMKRKKSEKRDQILDAARKLFLERGYASTRMEDIARDADLAIGTLYLYFENKNEIYASLCEDGLAILDNLFAKAAKEGKDCWEKMEALAKVNLRFYRKYRNYYDIIAFVFVGLKPEDLSAVLRDKIVNRISAILNHLEEIIREGMEAGDLRPGDVEETALILWSAVLGMVFVDQAGFMEGLGRNLNNVAVASMGMAFRGLKA